MLWISTAGGPLVVLPRVRRAEWRGVSDGGSDYELACSVDGYAGVVRWGDRDLLVLGDEPFQATVAVGEGHVVLMRWMFSPDEKSILRCLDPGVWGEPVETLCWVVKEADHVLCDASISGGSVEEGIEIPLAVGVHQVFSRFVKPARDVGAVVHDIRLVTDL